MALAEKLVTLRKEKRFTQMELAERLNVSRQAISRWEVGTAVPSTDNLKVLSELYGVSIDSLLNDAANPTENQKAEATEPPEMSAKKRPAARIWLVAVLILAVMITATVVIIASQGRDKSTPIGAMETVKQDNYSTDTFLID